MNESVVDDNWEELLVEGFKVVGHFASAYYFLVVPFKESEEGLAPVFHGFVSAEIENV